MRPERIRETTWIEGDGEVIITKNHSTGKVTRKQVFPTFVEDVARKSPTEISRDVVRTLGLNKTPLARLLRR